MPSFVQPYLLWGLLAVSLPVLIHLINLLRHKRVAWGAMEFLLASQKKNSTWIRLKELLLLLLRMAAVAALALMLAQPMLRNELSRFFGGSKTHHIVLLDDTFSMGDRWGDTAAFDQARRVLERLAEQVASQPTAQTFTLIRFSRSGGAEGLSPDLLEEQVNSSFAQKLTETIQSWRPSQLAVGPRDALESALQLLGAHKDDEHSIYLLSDFRAKDWSQEQAREVWKQWQAEHAESLVASDRSRAQIFLIQCVDAAHANLAIDSLEPAPGTHAAGVQMFFDVTVKNYSSQTASKVSVSLREDDRSGPALVIDEIGAGESETRRFPAYFATAGEHVVSASLESDSLEADNLRYCLVNVPASVPVLLIDGDPDLLNARFLATALAPGGAVKTGIDPRLEPPAYLNNHALDKFQSIFLLDTPRLDEAAVAALETFVRQGGGLGIFMGDQVGAAFYNEVLYREGQGLFPLPLIAKTQLLVDRLEKGADMEVAAAHPIFRIFGGERNGFLNTVNVDWYYSAPKDWKPPEDSSIAILARLRNGAPLVLERKFEEGRVLTVLTTAAPVWNNWGRNPSYVVAALEMQSYLAGGAGGDNNRRVGEPIVVTLDAARYQPRVRLMLPETSAALGARDAGNLVRNAEAAESMLSATFPETASNGIYEVQLTTTDNQPESRLLAVNVDAAEGDLNTVGSQELAEILDPLDFTYAQSTDFHFTPTALAGSNLSEWILYLLIVVLIGEQVLAYAASYHPPVRETA